MNDDEEICKIKWTVADVRKAYYDKYGHNGTDEEIKEAVSRIDTKALECRSIEIGWSFINEAVL